MLLGEYLPSIHAILGGETQDVGPTVVQAVLEQRGISPLYGDILAALELSFWVLSESSDRQASSAWKLSQRVSTKWPETFSLEIAYLCHAAWRSTAIYVREQRLYDYESLVRLAELDMARRGRSE